MNLMTSAKIHKTNYTHLFPTALIAQMQCGRVPIDSNAHATLRPPAYIENTLIIVARQIATPAELRPVADRADLTPLQHRLQRERKLVPQRVIAENQTDHQNRQSTRLASQLPIGGVVGLIALRQRTQQTRHLTPDGLVQTLTRGLGVAAEQERQPEEARLALVLRQEVGLLAHAFPVHRHEIRLRSLLGI